MRDSDRGDLTLISASDWETGISAHIDHLALYAVPTGILNPTLPTRDIFPISLTDAEIRLKIKTE